MDRAHAAPYEPVLIVLLDGSVRIFPEAELTVAHVLSQYPGHDLAFMSAASRAKLSPERRLKPGAAYCLTERVFHSIQFGPAARGASLPSKLAAAAAAAAAFSFLPEPLNADPSPRAIARALPPLHSPRTTSLTSPRTTSLNTLASPRHQSYAVSPPSNETYPHHRHRHSMEVKSSQLHSPPHQCCASCAKIGADWSSGSHQWHEPSPPLPQQPIASGASRSLQRLATHSGAHHGSFHEVSLSPHHHGTFPGPTPEHHTHPASLANGMSWRSSQGMGRSFYSAPFNPADLSLLLSPSSPGSYTQDNGFSKEKNAQTALPSTGPRVNPIMAELHMLDEADISFSVPFNQGCQADATGLPLALERCHNDTMSGWTSIGSSGNQSRRTSTSTSSGRSIRRALSHKRSLTEKLMSSFTKAGHKPPSGRPLVV